MPIIMNLDVMLAIRKIKSKELAEAIGITEQNLSILKTGKAKAIRFSTLNAICDYLNCQPGNILEYKPDTDPNNNPNDKQGDDNIINIFKTANN